jgi:hypothetical protein
MPVSSALTNAAGIAAISASVSVENNGQLFENEQQAPHSVQGSLEASGMPPSTPSGPPAQGQ